MTEEETDKLRKASLDAEAELERACFAG